MKNKGLIIGIIVLIMGIGLILGGILLTDNKNDKTEEKPKKVYKYNTLFELADQLYLDNSYLELPKNESDIYYMSIGEYKKRGFKEELLDSACKDDNIVFLFDPEHKEKYGENPLSVIEFCKEDSNTLSLLELAKQIYNNKEYSDLPQVDTGAHYMTISEYKRRGYNIELIDDSCPEDTKIIFFDEANKDTFEPGATPVFISSCKY